MQLRKKHEGPLLPYSGKGANTPKKGTPYRKHIAVGVVTMVRGTKMTEREIILHATKGYRNYRKVR